MNANVLIQKVLGHSCIKYSNYQMEIRFIQHIYNFKQTTASLKVCIVLSLIMHNLLLGKTVKQCNSTALSQTVWTNMQLSLNLQLHMLIISNL